MATDTSYVPGESVDVLTATIANSGTVSDALDIGQFRLMAFQFATMTGTTMTFQASATEDGTYVAVYDDAGNAVSVTVTDDAVVAMTGSIAAALAPCRFIKLVSGSSEAAERTIKVLLRS